MSKYDDMLDELRLESEGCEACGYGERAVQQHGTWYCDSCREEKHCQSYTGALCGGCGGCLLMQRAYRDRSDADDAIIKDSP